MSQSQRENCIARHDSMVLRSAVDMSVVLEAASRGRMPIYRQRGGGRLWETQIVARFVSDREPDESQRGPSGWHRPEAAFPSDRGSRRRAAQSPRPGSRCSQPTATAERGQGRRRRVDREPTLRCQPACPLAYPANSRVSSREPTISWLPSRAKSCHLLYAFGVHGAVTTCCPVCGGSLVACRQFAVLLRQLRRLRRRRASLTVRIDARARVLRRLPRDGLRVADQARRPLLRRCAGAALRD